MLRDKILRLRSEKKITQQELADAIGVSRQTVKRWETGESDPSASVILPLCQYFGISPNDLLEGEITEEGKVKENQVIVQRTERNKKIWDVSKYIGYLFLSLVCLYFIRNWYVQIYEEYIGLKICISFFVLLVYHFVMLKLDGKNLKRGESEVANSFVCRKEEMPQELKKSKQTRKIRNIAVYGIMVAMFAGFMIWRAIEHQETNRSSLPVLLVMILYVVFIFYFVLDSYFDYKKWMRVENKEGITLIEREKGKKSEFWSITKKVGLALMTIFFVTMFDKNNTYLFASLWFIDYREIYYLVALGLLIVFVVMIILLDRKLNRQK